MRETVYEWMKNLAVFYLFFTAVMNFLPDSKYNKYIRHFLGLLLILLLLTPVLRLFRLNSLLDRNFMENRFQEEMWEKAWSLEDFQQEALLSGYEREIEEQVRQTAVQMEAYPKTVEAELCGGEEMRIKKITVVVRAACSGRKREALADELERIYQLSGEEIQVLTE